MLKEIERAINRAFTEYGVEITTQNESTSEKNVLVTLIAVEVLKEITIQESVVTGKRTNKRTTKPDPTSANITVNMGGASSE